VRDTRIAMPDANAEIRDFDVPDSDIGRGHEGFFTWLGRWAEGWESWHVEDLQLQTFGDDHVIALFLMVARGGRSGLELERQDAIVYRVEDGQIVYMAYYNDQEAAFEALRRAA
jgi:ketosteroid isomerase-like protein